MAGSFSNFLEGSLLDHVFGSVDYTPPVTFYVALFTVTPSDSGGGTEVSGGSYARVAMTNNPTNFPNASSGITITDEPGGEALLVVPPSATSSLTVPTPPSPLSLYYDIQVKEGDGTVTTVQQGRLIIRADITRAII